MDQTLQLSILPGRLAVCRLEKSSPLPAWAISADFFSLTRTADELSIVCPEALVPAEVQAEKGWRGLKVEGPLDFALTGILARLSGALAGAGISLFAIATYDTDYILVKETSLENAVEALLGSGCQVKRE